jgi:hypothetical protein
MAVNIMTPNEGDIVYIFIHSASTVEQCKVTAKDFAHDGQCLVYGLTSKASFVVDYDDMYASAEECAHSTAKKHKEEYDGYYNEFDSLETLLLHLINSAINSGKHGNIEITAIINRASEFTGADMKATVEKYIAKIKEEENRIDVEL